MERVAASTPRLMSSAKHINGSSECGEFGRRLTTLLEPIQNGLTRVSKPPVVAQVNCGQWRLLQNWLCGLSRELAHLIQHVFVLATDECAADKLTKHFPQVKMISTGGILRRDGDGTTMAPASSSRYAQYAVFKVWLPYVIASLGVVDEFLVQDIDVAWVGDVLAHVRSSIGKGGGELFVTADTPLVDVARYPCGSLHWEADMPIRGSSAAVAAECHRRRQQGAVSSINGGFQYVRVGPWSTAVLKTWLGRCPLILRDGTDQPHLQRAIRAHWEGCRYAKDEDDGSSANSGSSSGSVGADAAVDTRNASATTPPLVVLSVDRFVSGRRDELWLAASPWAKHILFHANYATSWADKCTKLAMAGGLHLHASHAHAASAATARDLASSRQGGGAAVDAAIPGLLDGGRRAGAAACRVPTEELRACRVNPATGLPLKQALDEWTELLNWMCNATAMTSTKRRLVLPNRDASGHRGGGEGPGWAAAAPLRTCSLTRAMLHPDLSFALGVMIPSSSLANDDAMTFRAPSSAEMVATRFNEAMQRRQPLSLFRSAGALEHRAAA